MEGENVLVVQIESGLFHAANRRAEGMGLYIDSELAKRPWHAQAAIELWVDWCRGC